MDNERRTSERIDIELPVVITKDEVRGKKHFEFRGPGVTQNLSLGGMFISCTYQLKVDTEMMVTMDLETGELFTASARVSHCVPISAGEDAAGIGLDFIQVDQDNRERILRFFVSDRIRNYYEDRFITEFPHLEKKLTLKDVALIVNLWEEYRHKHEGN